MPLQVVVTEERRAGVVLRDVDACGGVFTPVPGAHQRPAYSAGPEWDRNKLLLFQCPVSAIPALVWEALETWWTARQLRGLVNPADLPAVTPLTRRAFAVFESEMQGVELGRQAQLHQGGAAAVAGVLAKLFKG